MGPAGPPPSENVVHWLTVRRYDHAFDRAVLLGSLRSAADQVLCKKKWLAADEQARQEQLTAAVDNEGHSSPHGDIDAARQLLAGNGPLWAVRWAGALRLGKFSRVRRR